MSGVSRKRNPHVINIKEEDIAKVARGVEFSGEKVNR